MAIADLTLGSFYGARSYVHRLDARTKFLIALLAMGICLYVRTAASFAVLYAFIALAVFFSRVPVRYTLKNLKFFAWLLTVAVLLNLFFVQGSPVVRFGGATVTNEGIHAAAVALARLVFTVVTASLLTLTTPALDLTEGLSRLLSFLRVLRLPVRELGLMSALSLSYLPVLVDEVRSISIAQVSRGATFHGRGLGVFRSSVSLLVPVTLSALRRADRLGLAMESRCFRTGADRTNFAARRIGISDLAACGLALGAIGTAALLGR